MEQVETVIVVDSLKTNYSLPFTVQHVSTLDELPHVAPFAIILTKNDQLPWFDMVKELRSKPGYKYLPLFYYGRVEDEIKDLFDGMADDYSLGKANIIQHCLETIPQNILDNDNIPISLLAYLYSRPELVLRGFINHHLKYVYYFPLLRVINNYPFHSDDWNFVQDLVARDLLVAEELTNEIQTCPACDSGLLNIRKSCPACHSINIKPQRLVHCFSCGKIGPVPEFLRQDRLICGECKVRLLELGVDYDKPLEDKVCNDCGHFFADENIDYNCLTCQRISTPYELKSRPLYNYKISRRAEFLVLGINQGVYRNFNQYFKVTDYDMFMKILAWQIKLVERYSSWCFTIMTLKVVNENKLIEMHGTANTERLMEQFFKNLQQIFRDSDLSSRHEDTLFFFLPMANQNGCLILIERLKSFIEQININNNDFEMAMVISYLTSSEILDMQVDNSLALSELQARLLESNHYFIGKK